MTPCACQVSQVFFVHSDTDFSIGVCKCGAYSEFSELAAIHSPMDDWKASSACFTSTLVSLTICPLQIWVDVFFVFFIDVDVITSFEC